MFPAKGVADRGTHMNVSQSLTLLWTPVTVVLSIVAVLVAAGMGFAAVRRVGYRPAYVALESLRFGIVCLAVLLFNQPEWIEEFRPQGKPSIAVLWDASPSMETRDVVRPGGSRSAPTTRREAVAPLTDSAFVERFAKTICRQPRAFFHAAARSRN